MRLYEIDRLLEQFEALLAESGGELEIGMEEEWQRLISSRDDKWRAYIAMIRQMDAEAAAFKLEAERLGAAAKSRVSSAAWLKARLLASMDDAGIDEVKTEIGKLKIMSAPNRPVLLRVELRNLPDELVRVRREPNMVAIGAELKAGNLAVKELAEFGPASRYVRIF
jgi:hypothetical protein